MIKFLFGWFNLSCHQATLLSVRKQEGGVLTYYQQFQMWWHHHICAACKVWEEQSAAIDTMLARFWNDEKAANQGSETMSEERKADITQHLHNAMKE